MNKQKEIETLLKRAGFSRIKAKGHIKWRHPTGAQLVTSSSPSDPNAARAVARELRKVCQQWDIEYPE